MWRQWNWSETYKISLVELYFSLQFLVILLENTIKLYLFSINSHDNGYKVNFGEKWDFSGAKYQNLTILDFLFK